MFVLLPLSSVPQPLLKSNLCGGILNSLLVVCTLQFVIKSSSKNTCQFQMLYLWKRHLSKVIYLCVSIKKKLGSNVLLNTFL